MSMESIITGVAIAAVVVLALWRFSSGNYGALSPSNEATSAYMAFYTDPECNYFISGSADFPSAIMGIKKTLTLDSDLWKGMEPTPAKMTDLVQNMTLRAAETNQFLQGYDILDEKGQKVGNWFSLPGMSIMIRRAGEDRLIVSTPPMEADLER